MKISYTWLKDYLSVDKDPRELSKVLTDIGLEIEGVETYENVKNGFRGFVIGEVLTCKKHPNADKLMLTTVDVGQNNHLPVVCGAPNVEAGQKVVVAMPGTEIRMGEKSFTIQKTKIRGEYSEGMICAEDELGLGDSHDGILVLDPGAKTGMPASEYFQVVTDTVFEIGLTPNRIDSASHYGVARDLFAFYSGKEEVKLTKTDVSGFAIDNTDYPVEVIIEDLEGCKRYSGITISGIQIAPSPDWMQNRLKAIGLNPINNVVDITNYILHETGQPLHAFDADKLAGKKIIVKNYPDGTKFTTLEEKEIKLSIDDTMISDAEKPVCIAGVLGGLNSGVTESTKNIFLECAYFNPVSVRKTARRHVLNTDSSFRFERGVDPNNIIYTLKRTTLLIKELAGGLISSEIVDVYPKETEPCRIDVLYGNIDRLVGKKIPHEEIKSILTSLEIKILNEKSGTLHLEIPTYRVDVTREADVIEDILRIYGYNNVEFGTKLNSCIPRTILTDREMLINMVSNYLVGNGFHEIMSNSITKSDYYLELKTWPSDKLVKLHNPLSSDLDVMRQTLLFGGLEAIAYNVNRQRYDLRLFEFGNIYALKKGVPESDPLSIYHEEPHMGILLTGDKYPSSWAVNEQESSFHQLKAYYENILDKMGIDRKMISVSAVESDSDIFSGGLVYTTGNGQILIKAGIIKEEICKKLDIDTVVFYADLYWNEMEKAATGNTITYKELPRYPEVRRDMALLLDDSITYSEIIEYIETIKSPELKSVNLFDYYKGKGIPEGKKSYGISFYLQDLNKTLTDKEIDRIIKKFQESLVNKFHAELR